MHNTRQFVEARRGNHLLGIADLHEMCRKTIVQLVVETADVLEHGTGAGTVNGEHPRGLSTFFRRRQFRKRHTPAR